MADDPRQELERLQRELAEFDAEKHNSLPFASDPEGADTATKRKAALLGRIRKLQEQISR